MKENLYRVVFCSRNLLAGPASETALELQNILAKARLNNAKEQITGALLYNAGNFAQVLEGDFEAIERTFEKIRRDSRHGEVTIIHSGPIEKREFAEWAMAFAGCTAADQTPDTTAAFQSAFAGAFGASDAILGVIREMVGPGDDSAWLDVA